MVSTVTQRTYLPADLSISGWSDIAAYFAELEQRTIGDVAALERWLRDLSEVEAVVSEEGAWRYIRMTLDTRDADVGARYQNYVAEVLPEVEQWTDKLQRKLMALPQVNELGGEGYPVLLRGIREQLRIFREANVGIQAELRTMAQEYSGTIGAMKVRWKGAEITLPQAGAILESPDRG
jgi:oligoendopeptidase F